MISIVGVGDIMPGGILAGVKSGFISQDVMEIMSKADIRVGTLETAVGDTPSFNPEKMSREGDVIYVKDDDLEKVKTLCIDIVSLANNHFFDLGVDGAVHTIEMLDKLGIKHIGAGNNIDEASKPVIETINGETVAFLAFCDFDEKYVGWCPYATKDKPGVNPMNESHVISEIKKYKSICDYVVVLPHWGKEHTYITVSRVFKASKAMIKAGADLILGSHPHRVQPVVNFKRAAVAYSMGNFLFPNRLLAPPSSTYYSETEIDIAKLPVTDGFPTVQEITYKKWKPLAMIGMIVNAQFANGEVKATYNLTEINEKGVVSVCKNTKVDKKLKALAVLLKYSPYLLIYFIVRCLNYAKYKLTIYKKK